MICTGVAPGLVAVVASRAFGGIGAGLCVVPAVSMVWRWFSDRQRGFASSFVFAGPSLAGVLLGPVGLRLIARYGPEGWRVPWFVFGALTLVAGLLIWAVIRDPSSQSRPRGENMSGSTARGWSGVAYWNLLRSPLLLRLALVYVALGFSAGIFMNLFMKRLIDDLGYSGGTAGNLYMIVAWTSAVGGILGGHASDRIGRRPALAAVSFLQVLSLVLTALFRSPAALGLSAALFGLSAGCQGIVGAACGDWFGSRLAVVAFSLVTLLCGVGAIGPTVGGYMADVFGTTAPSFLLAAGLGFVALIGALLLPGTRVRAGMSACEIDHAPGGRLRPRRRVDD